MHGWFWSFIFHARDIPFTEVMDYSSAFIMVLTLLYCMLLRYVNQNIILIKQYIIVRNRNIYYCEHFRITYKNNKFFAVITCGYLSTLYSHLSHLWSGYINYDYNMKFNIVIGN